jgi:hypothetical protein
VRLDRAAAVHRGQALTLGQRSRRRAVGRGFGRPGSAPRPRIQQVRVLQARAPTGGDRRVRRPARGRTSSRPGARARLHSLGWRLHPARSGGDRLPPPPGAVPPQACRQPRHRRLDAPAKRRAVLAQAIVGARPSLGVRRRFSQLRRARIDRPCDRVLRRQSPAPAPHQGAVRRREPLPLTRHMSPPRAWRSSEEVDRHFDAPSTLAGAVRLRRGPLIGRR